MINLKIVLFLLLGNLLYANTVSVNVQNRFQDILSQSMIYIDQSKKADISEIIQDKKHHFRDNTKNILSYGYLPNFNVWIKFQLSNDTNQTIHKIVEYENALTTDIKFYTPDNGYQPIQEGLFHISDARKTIYPIFNISIKPHETQTYYFEVSSNITTLIVKLNLWNVADFYEKEIVHQGKLALFFGAMIILSLYNFFIYFFTRDINYLYYVLYLAGIIIHHFLYVGIAYLYMVKSDWIENIIHFASFIVGFPALALALFTQSFLQIKQYPLLNKVLNIYMLLFPFLLSIFIITDEYNRYRNLFSVLLLIYLLALTIYSLFKKNRQAYFVMFGWLIFITAGMFMYLSSVGVFNIYAYMPYYVEISLVIEAIIFSIALADKIKQLQNDKTQATQKLLAQQENEKQRLQIKVNEKSNDLKNALNEKDLLLKELNHRVKNNMQTIVSLIRLQSDDVEDQKIQDLFTTIQNRINAMSHLHEMLYRQDHIAYINAYEYFEILIEELKESYDKDIGITYNIQTELKLEQAVYCGLILNELVSNSFKHAFPHGNGTIHIELLKEHEYYILRVSDNGIGYNIDRLTENLLWG